MLFRISLNSDSKKTTPLILNISTVYNYPPVYIKQNSGPDSVACGGFLLCEIETGLYKDLDAAAQKVILLESFLPQQQTNNTYMKPYTIFERPGTKLFEEYKAIAELQQNN